MKFTPVGKIISPHGLKGDLNLLVFSKNWDWADDLELCQLQLGESSQVFEIESLVSGPKQGRLRLKGIADRNGSEKWSKALFLIPEDRLQAKKGETLFLKEILGFLVFDRERKLGEIHSFSSNGPQDLLVVVLNGKSVEIPFVEAFIDEINWAEKSIRMHLPEGLLEVNE